MTHSASVPLIVPLTSAPDSLIEAVFLEYARILMNIAHWPATKYYCSRAGEKGRQLQKEIEHLMS